jgi:hypothetical protein
LNLTACAKCATQNGKEDAWFYQHVKSVNIIKAETYLWRAAIVSESKGWKTIYLSLSKRRYNMIGWIVVAAIIAFIIGFNYGLKDSKHENELLKADVEKMDRQIDALIRKDSWNANG